MIKLCLMIFLNFKKCISLCSVDGTKSTARLGRFINDNHIKPNSKIKIVSNTLSHLIVLIIPCIHLLLYIVLFGISNEWLTVIPIFFAYLTYRYWMSRKAHICVHLQWKKLMQEKRPQLSMETCMFIYVYTFCYSPLISGISLFKYLMSTSLILNNVKNIF